MSGRGSDRGTGPTSRTAVNPGSRNQKELL